ncbi:Hypothetical predicted protein [Mytilus galloprovincialis]|uniref:Uncharacterized protein n=1 Tax=Mytilus galloprovincialis TaxID=29158 RepID=A0A8B6BIH6_MYTGA|nr:Hypothetical predicted protein [Mytilus galloprovincialis]
MYIEGGVDMAFMKLAELAREANADIWEEKVDKYIDGDMKEDHGRSKAYRKLNDEDMDQLMSRYDEAIDNETNIDGSVSENSIDDDEEEKEEEEEEEGEHDESSTI